MQKTSDDARIQQILASDVFEHVAELRRDRTSNSSSEDSAEIMRMLTVSIQLPTLKWNLELRILTM